mmetsp:Transcript_93488/g.267511  ORF Transcript_93488/g.267511 Transcript_93488/m.267511 type:complete len:241 (-) Transcript_93488:396-1118(-)
MVAEGRARADNRVVGEALGHVAAPTAEPTAVEGADANSFHLAILLEKVDVDVLVPVEPAPRAVVCAERVELEEGVARVHDEDPALRHVHVQPRAVVLVTNQCQRSRPSRVAALVPVRQGAARGGHEQSATAALLALEAERIAQHPLLLQIIGYARLHVALSTGRQHDVVLVALRAQRANETLVVDLVVAKHKAEDGITVRLVLQVPQRLHRRRRRAPNGWLGAVRSRHIDTAGAHHSRNR